MTILDPFKSASVLIVGDIMLDTYLWGRVERISPEAPVPVVELERTSSIPGGAANVAVNVVGLGASTYLVGSVGTDDEGKTLRRSLADSGVRTEGIIESSATPTTHKTRVIAHSQQVVRIDRERRGELADAELAQVRKSVESALGATDAVIVSDYAKGFLSPEFVTWLIRTARAAGKSVCVDPKGRDYSRYKGASLITPNKREAADACGLSMNEPDLVRVAGERLLNELDCDAVLITEGEHGMTVFERGAESYHFEAAAQEVFDVTGAGDTVIATIATGLAAGLDLRAAAEIAMIAAGIVVQQVGTTAISAEALNLELCRAR